MFRLTSKYPDGTMTHAASIFCDHVGFEPTPQPSRSVVIYYYISDANGTAWGLTDASGTVVWSADYDSYGNATFSGTIDQPLRMPGQYHDTESGLYYNLARYYEPTTGRYLSVDPLRDAEDYTYAGGNPLKYVDPTGEFGAPGAVIGGGIELAVQLWQNDGDPRKVDYTDVAVSAAAGAVGVGLVGKIGAVGPLAKIGLQAIIGAVTSGGATAGKSVLNGECPNSNMVLDSAASGFVFGGVAGTIGVVGNSAGKIVQNFEAEQARRILGPGGVNMARELFDPLTPLPPPNTAKAIGAVAGSLGDAYQEYVSRRENP